MTTNSGKSLRPPDNARIILYLKDVNLPRPDKYQTAQLVAFLQQLLTHEGYYDEHLEFIRVERVQVWQPHKEVCQTTLPPGNERLESLFPPTPQIIASINPPSTVGRHALTTRFTARVRVHCMSYPNKDAMQTIFTQMVERVREEIPRVKSFGEGLAFSLFHERDLLLEPFPLRIVNSTVKCQGPDE